MHMRGSRAKLCVMWRGCRNAEAGGWAAEVYDKKIKERMKSKWH